MTDLTKEQIEELRGLAAKATPGPWSLYAQKLRPQFSLKVIEVHSQCAGSARVTPIVKWAGFDDSERPYAKHKANAALIVAMRNALPALLDLATASLAGASATPGQRINGLNDALAFAQGDTSRARVIQPKGGDASAETRVHPDATSPGVTAGASAGDGELSADEIEVLQSAKPNGFIPHEIHVSRVHPLYSKGYLHASEDGDEAWLSTAGKDALKMHDRLRSQAREIEALTEGSADKDDEIAMLRDSAARWIARLSVVRELTGDHGKMMLADFTEWFSERWTALLFAEDQIEALKRERDEAIKAAPYCELVEATPENQLETMLYDTLKERDNLRARAEAAEWKEQFHSAAAAASEYSEFYERHHADFDAAGNYIPHSQLDGDLRAAESSRDAALARVGELEAALEPFATVAAVIDHKFGLVLFKDNDTAFLNEKGCVWVKDGEAGRLTWGDFRRARSALEGRK